MIASLLLRYQWRKIYRYFTSKRLARSITAILFFIVFIGVGVGIYAFFKTGLRFTAEDPFLRVALPLFIYELFLLLFAYLIGVSSFITGLFTLFRSPRNNWIISSPHFGIVPWYAYTRILFSSIWPLFIIVFPALLAIQHVFDIGIGGLLLTLFSVILLIALIISSVIILLLGLGKILYLFRRLSLRWILVLSLMVFMTITYTIWSRTVDINVVTLFRAEDLEMSTANIEAIQKQFSIFPTHLTALTLTSVQSGEFNAALVQIGKLILLLASAELLILILAKWFLPIWQKLQEGSFEARVKLFGSTSLKPIRFPRYFKSPLGAILEKEIIVFVRSPRNILWMSFLLLLWLMQSQLNTFLSRTISTNELSPAMIPHLVQVLQFATVIFFMTAFVLRFAFPSFSTEHKNMWIIVSAPIDLGKIFWSKFVFFGGVFIALGVLATYWSNASLALPILINPFLFFLLLGVAILFTTALGLGLGAIFPNFETDDPQMLSTTLPGLLFTTGALLYGGIGSFALYRLLIGSSITPILIYVVISILLGVYFLHIAAKTLRRTEFSRMIN